MDRSGPPPKSTGPPPPARMLVLADSPPIRPSLQGGPRWDLPFLPSFTQSQKLHARIPFLPQSTVVCTHPPRHGGDTAVTRRRQTTGNADWVSPRTGISQPRTDHGGTSVGNADCLKSTRRRYPLQYREKESHSFPSHRRAGILRAHQLPPDECLRTAHPSPLPPPPPHVLTHRSFSRRFFCARVLAFIFDVVDSL